MCPPELLLLLMMLKKQRNHLCSENSSGICRLVPSRKKAARINFELYDISKEVFSWNSCIERHSWASSAPRMVLLCTWNKTPAQYWIAVHASPSQVCISGNPNMDCPREGANTQWWHLLFLPGQRVSAGLPSLVEQAAMLWELWGW